MIVLLVIVVNIVVGGLVGLTGIAGFLLPMLYVSLGYSVGEALALSFCAFLISGVIGSINYYKHGQLNVKFGMKLGVASLVGATLGVYLNNLIDEGIVRVLLYLVVLFSGISILLRKDREGEIKRTPSVYQIFLVGFTTSIVCALSGAGGPILVMPLLVLLGVNIREAIALALFDSIFIAIPSVIGYLGKNFSYGILEVLFISAIAHGVGVFLGSRYSMGVNKLLIKRCVAIISIIVAVYKLIG